MRNLVTFLLAMLTFGAYAQVVEQDTVLTQQLEGQMIYYNEKL